MSICVCVLIVCKIKEGYLMSVVCVEVCLCSLHVLQSLCMYVSFSMENISFVCVYVYVCTSINVCICGCVFQYGECVRALVCVFVRGRISFSLVYVWLPFSIAVCVCVCLCVCVCHFSNSVCVYLCV